LLSIYVRHKLSNHANPGLEFRRIERFDRRFDKLMEDVLPSFRICGVRDSAYLRWRYLENPVRKHAVFACEEKGMLHGFFALELVQNGCVVFDLFMRNRDELLAGLIHFLVEYATTAGSAQVVFVVNPSGPYSRVLRHWGFRFGYRSRPRSLMVLTSPDEPEAAYLGTIENWYLTYADEDIESLEPPEAPRESV
jgi:hypothetical protein